MNKSPGAKRTDPVTTLKTNNSGKEIIGGQTTGRDHNTLGERLDLVRE